MVPVDSSAARMPRPGATMASATLFNSLKFIFVSRTFGAGDSAGIFRICTLFTGGSWSGFRNEQHFYARQGFAFERLQKGAARGRDMGQPAHDGSGVERRDRVAAPGKTDKLFSAGEFRDCLCHLDGAVVERLNFEGAERAIPHQR